VYFGLHYSRFSVYMYILGTVFGAVLQRVPLRQASEVGDVVIVEFRAGPLTDDSRPVTTSQFLQPRVDALRHPGTLRTFRHHATQLIHPLMNLHRCSKTTATLYESFGEKVPVTSEVDGGGAELLGRKHRKLWVGLQTVGPQRFAAICRDGHETLKPETETRPL